VTREAAQRQAQQAREAWEKTHPDAKEGTGPFPFRTTLTLRRRGVAVRQEVVVKFADGSSENVIWDSPKRWQRYTWVKPVQAVSAEIDPAGKNTLDTNVLDNSRTIKPDASASRLWTGHLAALVQTIFSLMAAL
jgi:hypothetical protein